MTPELIARYGAPVPRYTSYPTALQFNRTVGAETMAGWLDALTPTARLSLYVHIPFCHQLCWYCGCNTKATRSYEPVAVYLRTLIAEISNLSGRLASGQRIHHIHWGGGSPNILTGDDILRLSDALRAFFDVAPDAEFAVEVDPRNLHEDQVRAFVHAGVNRVSIGVQDLDPAVQAAINREQSLATTRAAIDAFRRQGVLGVNIDLVYGLPYQTVEGSVATLEQVIALAPDRIALFGYAHLPERLHHQRLIEIRALPGLVERFEQQCALAGRLVASGYRRIGLDHFARPGDPLAGRKVRRNFQGYTQDAADALIGLGASAISSLPQGHAQNAVPVGEYARRVRQGSLATERGHALSDDDRMRAFVIERLMCDLAFPTEELIERFGAASKPLLDIAHRLVEGDADRLLQPVGRGFRLTERGRPFVRTIAAAFDAYLPPAPTAHASGV